MELLFGFVFQYLLGDARDVDLARGACLRRQIATAFERPIWKSWKMKVFITRIILIVTLRKEDTKVGPILIDIATIGSCANQNWIAEM